MPATNDITGDQIITGATTDLYRDGWERIFGKRSNTVKPDSEDSTDTTE